MEQQARKAEAAQKRRMQVEKAARESEVHLLLPVLGFLAIYGLASFCNEKWLTNYNIEGWGNKENIGPGFQQEEKRREDSKGARRNGTGKETVLMLSICFSINSLAYTYLLNLLLYSEEGCWIFNIGIKLHQMGYGPIWHGCYIWWWCRSPKYIRLQAMQVRI